MNNQIYKRTSQGLIEIQKKDTLIDSVSKIKDNILEAIQNISPFSTSKEFTIMKKGGVGFRSSMFLKALRDSLINSDNVQILDQSETKHSLMIDDKKLAVSLVSDKLVNNVINIKDTTNTELPTIEEYPVDAFLIAQINSPERDQKAAFTIISYKDIVESNRAKYSTQGKIVFSITSQDIQNIYYEEKNVKKYRHNESYRKSLTELMFEDFGNNIEHVL